MKLISVGVYSGIITISNKFTIAMITINTITITIFSIIPGRMEHTFVQDWWDVGCTSCLTICDSHLFFPPSKSVCFIQHQTLQSTTPWSWGIVRLYHRLFAQNSVVTVLTTDITIVNNKCHIHPSTHHRPQGTLLLGCNLASAWIDQRREYHQQNGF